MYGHCTDTSVHVHNYTSFPIIPDQPCDAGESLLRAGAAPSELPPSRHHENLLRQLVIPCTYIVHTLYIHGSYIDILCTCALFIQFLYHRGNFHCELACNPFMIGLDSAYRQESANRYIHIL